MIVTILVLILILGVLVFVHELGHFILAKANGVMVLEFSLGFGPKLISFKRGETVYSIKLLPFGGACMMLGEDFMDETADDSEDDNEKKDEKQDEKYRRCQ